MSDERLLQLIEYARALAIMARNGRGNVKDTADILRALEMLRANRQFDTERKRAA